MLKGSWKREKWGVGKESTTTTTREGVKCYDMVPNRGDQCLFTI
jgi:hypothetical protein